MSAGGRVPYVEDTGAFLVSAHQKKNTAGLQDAKGLRLLFVFIVSSGDICGKKTSPCGEDAVCNQTNVNSICQCKAGFQRNQKSGQCEGDTSRFSQSFAPFSFLTCVSVNRLVITIKLWTKKNNCWTL